MRSLFLVMFAVGSLGAGLYVAEWMPREAIASASAVASATAAAPVEHPQEIRSVRLDGDRLPLTILEARLTTRVGDSLDAAVLDVDRRGLREALMARGYWAADVAAPEVVFDDDGGAHVSFRITTGAVFHVRSVAITGDAAALAAEALTLTQGDDVSPQRLARNAELLADHLARHGHAGAKVTVETTTDRDSLAVDVRFVVQRAAR